MAIAKLKIESTPYTYVLEWSKTRMRYIGASWRNGCHPNDLWSKYFTSSRYVAEYVLKHGAPDVILIDKTFSNAYDAMGREIELLKLYDVKNNHEFLNKAIGGKFDFNDPEIRGKMSKAQLGKKHTDENKKKIGIAHKGKITKESTKLLMSIAHTGKKLSESHVENMRKSLIGNSRRLGTKTSEQARLNLAKSMLGKKHSIETKLKMSKAHSGRKYKEVTCPHCDKIGGESAMKRWHFNYCKLKKEP